MGTRTALKIVFAISIVGILFSGYLSYFELFAAPEGASCGAAGMEKIPFLTWPACVYGFIMYSIVFAISLIGLISKKD